MSTAHPILFSAPMVRAILAGTKTQTRRIVKPQPIDNQQADGHFYAGDHSTSVMMDGHPRWREQFAFQAARWNAGDTLWVKETHRFQTHEHIEYRADGSTHRVQDNAEWLRDKDISPKWKPSIFMPLWASRINLDVLAVRVERLQDITEEDAIAEGIEQLTAGSLIYWNNYAYKGPNKAMDNLSDAVCSEPVESYRTLWNSINLAPSPLYVKKVIVAYESYPWSDADFDSAHPGVREAGIYRGKPINVVANPWVWVITFSNIDRP